MIELRPNGKGGYEKPGPHTFGRVYKIVNVYTGQISYNCTTSDLSTLDPHTVAMIEGYNNFLDWIGEIMPKEEAEADCRLRNKMIPEFIETEFTQLRRRVEARIAEGDEDLKHLVRQLQGYEFGKPNHGRSQPAMKGWE